MAEFILLSDPNADRATAFLTATKSKFDRLPYPIRDDFSLAETHLLLLRNAPTPLASNVQKDERIVLSVGDSGERTSPASSLATLRPDDLLNIDQVFSDWLDGTGFGFFVSIERNGRVRLAADQLGLFPVYLFRHRDVVLAASTPSFIIDHPLCGRSVDPIGMTGILMYSFPSADRTLWQSVKRLRPGHAAEFNPPGGLVSRQICRKVPEHEATSLQEAADEFDAMLTRWATVSPRHSFLQLSGGLDSRIIAAYLSESPNSVREAWTYGKSRDLEVRTARRVAAHCDFRHRVIPVDTEKFVTWAFAQIDAGHLSNAMSDFSTWAVAEFAGRFESPVASGYLGDLTMGGNHIGRALPDGSIEKQFSIIGERLNRGYGLDKNLIRQLVLGDSESWMETCYEELFQSYCESGQNPHSRGWWFDLAHRDRLNIGRLFLQISRYSWPLLPYVQPRLVETSSRLAPSLIGERRLQRYILMRRFPGLAAIPLDRGQLDRWPIHYSSDIARWTWRFKEGGARRVRKLLRAFGIERRVNHRLWDFDKNPGWQAIRAKARQDVDALSDLLDPDTVLTLIRPPEEPISLGDPLKGTGLKTLAGLVLWAGKYR